MCATPPHTIQAPHADSRTVGAVSFHTRIWSFEVDAWLGAGEATDVRVRRWGTVWHLESGAIRSPAPWTLGFFFLTYTNTNTLTAAVSPQYRPSTPLLQNYTMPAQW